MNTSAPNATTLDRILQEYAFIIVFPLSISAFSKKLTSDKKFYASLIQNHKKKDYLSINAF